MQSKLASAWHKQQTLGAPRSNGTSHSPETIRPVAAQEQRMQAGVELDAADDNSQPVIVPAPEERDSLSARSFEASADEDAMAASLSESTSDEAKAFSPALTKLQQEEIVCSSAAKARRIQRSSS